MCAPFSLSKDNVELQLQTNYLSHFYLTSLLLPTLLSTASSSPPNTVRIINVSSDGHAKLAPSTGFDFKDPNLPNASPWTRYGHSKLAQVLHSKELARRFGSKGIVALSCHPGTVKTGLSAGPRATNWWYRYIQPLVEMGAPGPEGGARSVLWCAVCDGVDGDCNGGYFLPVGKKTKASKCGEDAEMAKKLWEWSEKRVQGY